MRLRNVLRCVCAAVVFAVAVPLSAAAQQSATPPTPQQLQQAPDSGTPTEIPARLRHLEGTVTVQRAAAGETEDAVMNLPLGSGDRLWSAEDGRVEVMFEDGTTLWLDSGTTLDFVSLPRPQRTDGSILRLWTGSVFVHRPEPGALMALRLDTPSGAVTFDDSGLFRIDLDEEQVVWLEAYDGTAVLSAGGIDERISAGYRAVAEPGTAPSEAIAFNTSQTDEFGNWRDQRMAQYATTRQYAGERDYLPANVVSYAADLEPHGSWNYHPTYASWYWKPHAAVAWSPYRDGRWVYGYGGWSWVPRTSWGYVTTHYGRWHHGSGGWIWFPGATWAPASVHWYVGGGYVGWTPLNYYGRPAVSFGVHVGGRVSVSFGVNFGGYYGYGYRYPYYGYYGYGHHYWGYRPCYGCCYRCGNYYGGHRPVHYPKHYSNYRGQATYVGPIGSASGTGRVVNRLGYSSGLADAWTVVPSDEFETTSTGRAAVARSGLPAGLDQASSARVSGTMRARRPGNLVPNTVRPTTDTGRRSAVARGATPTVGRSNQASGTLNNSAQRRTATTRSSLSNPAAGAGAVRAASNGSGVRRAVPTTRNSSNAVGGAVRATSRAAPNASSTTAPTGVRRAMSRPSTRSSTRATAPAVPNGASRRALTRPAATGSNQARRPTTTTRSTRYPSSTVYPSSGATRRATVRSPNSSGSVQRAPTPSRSLSPSRRSATPTGRSIMPSRSRVTPSTRSVVPSRRPSTSPNRSVLPSATRRSAVPRGVSPRTSSPRSSVGAPARSPSFRAPTGRAPSMSRPSPSVRSAPTVRPPSGSRSGGGGSRAVRRSAKPKGGS